MYAPPPFNNYNRSSSRKRAYDASGPYPIQKYNTSSYNSSKRVVGFTPIGAAPINKRSTRTGNYSRNSGPYRLMSISTPHNNPIYPRPEQKFIDLNSASTPYTGLLSNFITNTGTVVGLLQEIIQGVRASERIGFSISVTSLAYRYRILVNSLNSAPANGRVIFVWDKQPNGSIPSFAAIFETSDYLSFNNIPNKDRFVILRNDMFSLNPSGNTTMYFEGFVKICMNSNYNQGVKSHPVSGNLLLCYVADQPLTTQPGINGFFRVRYVDT